MNAAARHSPPVHTATPNATNAQQALDALALACRNGVQGAAEQLLTQLAQDVARVVRQRALRYGRLAPDADVQKDLVQDLILELWQSDLQTWQPERGSFLTYARRKIGWRMAGEARRVSRFVATDASPQGGDDDVKHGAMEALLSDRAGPATDPETLIARREHWRQLARLEREVRALPTPMRRLVRAVDLDERSLTDVAKRNKQHVSSACRLRQRAHAELARALAA